MKIEIQNLQKRYDNGYYALKGVDLTINDGVFGLLGPNGAGKSTFMRIMVTLMKPSEGTILVDGYDIAKDRKKIREWIGYLPQDFRFFANLKCWEFLDYSARLAGMKRSVRNNRIDEMLESVGLLHVRNKSANKLSGGMKRRLGIAQALINEPRLIIVDEPTTGLDPEERIRFRNLLTGLGNKDRIIVLSTHIVGDISSSCDQMALLNTGEVAYKGSPDGLIEQAQGYVWQVKATQEEYEKLKISHPIIATIPADGGWELQVVGNHLDNYQAQPISPNLEHAYVCFMEDTFNIWKE